MDEMNELVKMSTKGQLVVPEGIRRAERFQPGERFVAFPLNGGVLFKRVKIQRQKFEDVAKQVEQQFRKQKIHPSDVKGAVAWTRR